MGILAGVTRGKVQRPHLVLIYATDGWGKSTMASEAPAPLFLGAEEGTNNLDVARLAPKSVADVRAALTELATTTHEFGSVVVDTLDWLAAMIEAEVIAGAHDTKITSLEDFGYGKGRVRAYEMWRELLPAFTALRDRGINVIALAHASIKKFEDPALPQGYDRYGLKLQSGANSDVAGLWREYVDSVVFGNYDVSVSADDKRRAFGQGERVLYTERRPGFEAKNRFSMPAELKMVKGRMWAEYARYVEAAPERSSDAKVLQEQIAALVPRIKNQGILPQVHAAIVAAGDDVAQLRKLVKRLDTLIGKEA